MFGNTYFPKRYFADRYFPIGDGFTPVPDDGLLGGGGYVHPYHKYKDEFARQERDTAQKIAEAEHRLEAKRAEAKLLADELRNNEILAQELFLQESLISEEINRFLMERADLIRRVDDEEAALVLMLSMPFSS